MAIVFAVNFSSALVSVNSWSNFGSLTSFVTWLESARENVTKCVDSCRFVAIGTRIRVEEA